jgi:hypothetical protein
VVLAGLAAAVPAAAQRQSVPDGIAVGPWIVAPWLGTEWQVDDNLLRQPDSVVEDLDLRESSTEWTGGLTATLPFRNSKLELDYESGYLTYSTGNYDREFSYNAGVLAEFAFSTGDFLTLEDRFDREFIQIEEQFDEDFVFGAEERFQGQPYDDNRWTIQAERPGLDRQGYRVRIQRRDRNYAGSEHPGLYDVRGFDNVFEYTQPLGTDRALLVHYNPRRFNHYRVEDPVGVPFRKEQADSLQAGVTGEWRGGNSYLARVGYERLDYVGEESSFRGMSYHLQGRLPVGGRTGLFLALSRRALPSTLDTYYIANAVRAALDRTWTRTLDVAVAVNFDLNGYGAPTGEPGCIDETRKDIGMAASADVIWQPQPRMGFTLGAHREHRNSNCELSNYEATEVRAGFTLGWF